MDTIEKGLAAKERQGNVKEGWSEMKKAILESAQKHLQGRHKKHSRWMSDTTIETKVKCISEMARTGIRCKEA